MEAVLVIAGAVAIVWGAVLFLRGGLLAGCVAVIVAGTCFGYPFFHVPLSPVPLTIDRVLWVVLLAQYAVWRRFNLADPKPLRKAELALGLLYAVLLISLLAHDWRAHNAQPASRFVFYYLMPFGMYWVARQARLSARGMLAADAVLGAFGIYLAFTALAETQQISWLIFPKYISSPEYPEFFGRGRGPLLNPIGTGFFMSACLYALAVGWPHVGRAGKAMIVAGATLIAAGLYATLTRSVWLGAGLGLMVITAATLPRRWRMPVLGGTLIVVAIVAATQWERFVAFKRDRDLGAHETAESVKLRPILARVAWNMFRDRPLFGCGFGHYRDESINYLSDRSTDLPLEVARPYVQHNAFLGLLTETGLAGLVPWILVLVFWGHDAWRLWRSDSPLWARQQGLLLLAVLASYVVNAMFHDVSLIPMFHMLLFFVAGLAAAAYAVEREDRPAA